MRTNTYKKLLFLPLSFITIILNAQTFEWAKSFGNSNSEQPLDIATDDNGNVCVTGSYSGSVDFDPGASVFNMTSVNNTSTDAYVLKLDATGAFVWAKSFDGVDYLQGTSVDIDASGNIYLTGIFNGTVDFDPGPGTTNLTSNGGSSNTGSDIFIVKLDANGDLIWVKTIGDTGGEMTYSIAIDVFGNPHIAGRFQNTVDFDPGAGVLNLTSNGLSDMFILKLNSSGNLIWAKSFGGSSNDEVWSVDTDLNGNVYS